VGRRTRKVEFLALPNSTNSQL